MSKVFFDLVPKFLKDPIYLDISRDEIELILGETNKFDRTYEDTDTEMPFRISINQRGNAVQSISLAILVHEIRIAGIDFEVKFDDKDGRRQQGWHKHLWNPIKMEADSLKEAVDCFSGVDDLRQWLIRAFKELGIQTSGKDYGEPILQFTED